MTNYKQALKGQLRAIHKELCAYSESVFTEMTKQKYFLVSLKYSVILQAIEDLHCGEEKHQQSAIAYFKGESYLNDCIAVGISEVIMNKIVYSPGKYASKIGYVEVADEDLLYFEG